MRRGIAHPSLARSAGNAGSWGRSENLKANIVGDLEERGGGGEGGVRKMKFIDATVVEIDASGGITLRNNSGPESVTSINRVPGENVRAKDSTGQPGPFMSTRPIARISSCSMNVHLLIDR